MSSQTGMDVEHVLTPWLLREIEAHKYRVSCAQGEILLAEVIPGFIELHPFWQMEEHKAFTKREYHEVEKHKWIESEKKGKDIGRNSAAIEWLLYAKEFRDHWESFHAHGFLVRGLTLQEAVEGALLGDAARGFDCTSYAHSSSMNGHRTVTIAENRVPRHYVDLRSPKEAARLPLREGDEVRIVTYGNHAQQALDALATLVSKPKTI